MYEAHTFLYIQIAINKPVSLGIAGTKKLAMSKGFGKIKETKYSFAATVARQKSIVYSVFTLDVLITKTCYV